MADADYGRWWERAYPTWEPWTRKLLGSVLSPGDLFLDVGAWIGPVSRWADGLGAQVIAVEPDRRARGELKRVLPGAEVWACAAVTEEADGADVRLAYLDGEPGTSEGRLSGEGELAVKGCSLRTVLMGRKPKLATIDVEGHEEELLPEAAPYLASLRTVVQVELHGGYVPPDDVLSGFAKVTRPTACHVVAWP